MGKPATNPAAVFDEDDWTHLAALPEDVLWTLSKTMGHAAELCEQAGEYADCESYRATRDELDAELCFREHQRSGGPGRLADVLRAVL